ncbi:signal recognition particle-docking protein FtsY [Coxiella burnetii]|uniref:Signal recognition particle receptor FtsY n=2 Tax=Coxiella burnetii TaxID=777 RepID=Q83AI3_COXBU|nr:signal recognition particle-docking protein FtsY [Coxiella burnetii]NP_820880.1 cell division protein [Coxiella burnetii RSA 493]AAO91394.1 cell division protein [Coxiella burnetii RSA 493]ABS77530.1 cell division protein [Coxiella burnetii Dugway 5J108-111]AML48210.1 cell division protein FtsY [Coxiella burnetii]AML54226.1 cell division protein FtsY [Coxiella burnetii]ARI66653.1 signal recognition particle-docking protein FtsY [Coxiella burnetii]
MFGFSKSKPPLDKNNETSKPKKGWLGRLNESLKRTRSRLTDGLSNLVLGKKTIDASLLEELEMILLSADIGIEATQSILNNLSQQVARKSLSDPKALIDALKIELLNILEPCQKHLEISASPFVILTVGVNGVGKTTTIAKLAHFYQSQKKRVMLAAGDTFRAAAIEQLQTWGQRNNAPVIAQQPGADSASVIYDAMEAATARHYDLLIADTAGRLHTQSHLMDELAKIKRVMKKINPDAPHETLLVLDAGTGQNAINQAEQFHEHIGLTGIAITKLDGTAKGGVIFAIAKKMQLPIRFIGMGEKIEDLKPFNAKEFIAALFKE